MTQLHKPFYVVCSSMKPKLYLILVFQSISLLIWGQLPNTKLFYSTDGFCSTSILMDSLGNAYRESGCEGRSSIALGTYRLKNDIVDFQFQNFDSESPIFEIQQKTPLMDSLITITILSRQGNPIPNTYFTVDAIDSSGRHFKTIKLNDAGQLQVNFKIYKELRLDYLEKIYGRKVRMPVSNSDVTVILNLPKFFFYYPRPRPVKGNNLSLRIKKTGLYDLAGKERLFLMAN
ncbi:MAG: hypothetical protein JWQ27_64 [Ferruginibacter sp.]|nr:hypothetical protein [Ferruginibacter sp.]